MLGPGKVNVRVRVKGRVRFLIKFRRIALKRLKKQRIVALKK